MTRCGLAAILCALPLAACAPARDALSELSWAACRDGIDNDLDGLPDCADPDCRAIPCVDAGGADAATGDAAHADASMDAAADCVPACAPGEICNDHQCSIPLPAMLRIEILSMDGPSTNAILTCFDFAGGECGLAAPCSVCPPDPFVRVDVERPRPGGGSPMTTTIARTTPKEDTEIASWGDDDRLELDLNPVLLQPQDNLLLVAVDADGTRESPPDEIGDDLMFECPVPAASLRMGPQRCAITPSSPWQSSKTEFEIWFKVRLP